MASDEESIKGLPEHVKKYPRVSHVLDYVIATHPRVIEWALRFYEDGGHPLRYMDDKASAGTQFHEMMEAHVKDGPLTPPEEWKGEYDSTVKELGTLGNPGTFVPEIKLWSDKWHVRGTCDLMACNAEGRLGIVDYKTGRHRRTHPIQLLFYREMAIEQGHPVEWQEAWHPMKTKVSRIEVPYEPGIVEAVMKLYSYLEE